jgi:hypothetical protein
MPNIYNLPEFDPDMAPAEAARIWMLRNECTDTGLKTITYGSKEMSVNYKENPHGIVIIAHDGTAIPVPYRYNGSTHNLLY